MGRWRSLPVRAGVLFLVAFLFGGNLAFLEAQDWDENGNEFYTIFIRDTKNTGKIGVYSLGTSSTYPGPPGTQEKNILHGAYQPATNPSSSYLTVRSYTTGTDYVNRSGTPNSSFVVENLNPFGVVEIVENGFKTTYTLPGPPQTPDKLIIVQEVIAEGTALDDSRIRVTTSVSNEGSGSVQIGIRYLWDIMIGPDDDSFFRTVEPDTPFTQQFTEYPDPQFRVFEAVNELASPLFHIYGTVNGEFDLHPTPTAPDHLMYALWSDANNDAWDFVVQGGKADSSVVHFWGFDQADAFNISQNQSAAVTAYIGTVLFPPPGSDQVPTLTEWGALILAGLLGLLIAIKRRS